MDSPMDMDKKKRQANIEAGHALCKQCNGTGNELYHLYRACSACEGTGRLKRVQKKVKEKYDEFQNED